MDTINCVLLNMNGMKQGSSENRWMCTSKIEKSQNVVSPKNGLKIQSWPFSNRWRLANMRVGNCENRTTRRRREFSEVARSFCTRSSVTTISSAGKTVHYFDLSPTTNAHRRNWYGRRTAVNRVSRTATVHGDRPRTGIKWVVCETDGEMNIFNFALGPAEKLCALHTSPPTTDAPGEMWEKTFASIWRWLTHSVTLFVIVPRQVNPFLYLVFIRTFYRNAY